MSCGIGDYSPKMSVMKLLCDLKNNLMKEIKLPTMAKVEASLPLLAKEGLANLQQINEMEEELN